MGVIAAVAVVGALLGASAVLAAGAERLLTVAGGRGPAVHVRLRRPPPHPPADRWLYEAAPFVALAGVACAAVVLPAGGGRTGADLSIGLFYYIVVVDLVALAVAMGGWGAHARASIEACYRVVAQLVAYVVPLGLAILGPVMMAGSLSTAAIVEAQTRGLPFIVSQPLGFALYLVTALMQTYRPPFHAPFAPEIDGGVLGVYGGWRAALWRLALSGLLGVAAAMGAVLFLGGPAGPWLPGWAWLLGKTAVMLVLLVGLGRALGPRTAVETVLLAWKILIPVGLANVLVVGGLILLGIGGRT